jgi:ABC-type multidrug transport system fused ATPase/permease subunit
MFLMLESDGIVRAFLIIGVIIGWILYRCTVGVAVMAAARVIIDFVKAILAFLKRFLVLPAVKFVYLIALLMTYPFRAIGRKFKKILKNIQIRLKVRHVIMYNRRNNIRNNKKTDKQKNKKTKIGLPKIFGKKKSAKESI